MECDHFKESETVVEDEFEFNVKSCNLHRWFFWMRKKHT